MRYIKVTSAICLLLLAGGCYDKIELNELAVGELMAIDLSEDGRLKVSIQFVIPRELTNPGNSGGGNGGGNGAPFYVIDAVGSTLPEAFSFLQAKLPRRLFTSHIRAVILGEEFARAGISAIFDGLSRLRELRITMDVVVALGEGAELLKVAPRLEKLPSTALSILLYQSILPTRTVRELLLALTSQGTDLFLPAVGIAERSEPGVQGGHGSQTERQSGHEFEMIGIGIFRGDRLVGFASRESARGLAWLINEVTEATTTIEWPPKQRPEVRPEDPESELSEREELTQSDAPPGSDRSGPSAGLSQADGISSLLVRGNAKRRVELEGDELVIRIDARGEDDIVANQAGLDLADPAVIAPLEAALSQDLEERMRTMLHLAQDVYQADIFGFGEMIHRAHPKLWAELRKDWHTAFAKLKVYISAQIKIRRVGLSNRPASLREEQIQN